MAWILLSGLDDLFIDLVCFVKGRKPFPWPSEADLTGAPQRRIAILVPLWREHDVIQQMLQHNLAVIRYANYDFFVGVYLNDLPTIRAVRQAASADPRVHVALCPHAGPTSKGDCLNSAYRALGEYEARYRVRFEIVMTHDAEDLIHPESLRLVNWFSREYQMIQMPVLPLATATREWMHGLYCDEFAEYQFKDIPVRQHLGGFLPGNGVGTGFVREALERIRQEQGQVFDPECLTEDYETGFRIHAAGYRQIFLPIRQSDAGPVATREYFPRRWRSAIRQRSRWVAGITLQGWERHGWRAPGRQRYWFWRDRKGLVGNLFSALTNLVFFGWLVGTTVARHAVPEVHLPGVLQVWLPRACFCSAGMALLQIGVRISLSARIYGAAFAAATPLRILWGNAVNGAATAEAVRLYAAARIRRRALAWRKTEHVYPVNPLLIHRRPRLGEVLVSLRCISLTDLEAALSQRPLGVRMGEYLIQLKKITESELSQALSSQAGVPVESLAAPAPAHAAYRNFGLDST
ncbi:MAG: glycosyl transferase family protein [Acidobacteriia bacterium]|nr:glycosyl transferase family protein [Terriglobia bacterium]